MLNSIAYGTYRLRGDKCYENVKKALLIGYRTIDTAKLYENHSDVGRAIKDVIGETTLKREDIIVTSKIHFSDQENETVYISCHEILKELGLDYIDIMLLHSPIQEKIIKSYTDLTKAKNEGLIRQIGVSNFDIDDLNILINKKFIPYVNQIELSIFFQRKELVKFCKKNNIIVQAHSCLTNKIKLNEDKLLKLANEFEMTTADLMILWCLNIGVCIAIGSTDEIHMRNNLQLENKSFASNYKFDDFEERFFIFKKYIK